VVDRRALIDMVVGCVLALPLGVKAQSAGKLYLIGYLHPSTANDPGRPLQVLKQALADLGYVVDQNIKFEERFAEGKFERLPSFAAEFVALHVDVIVAVSPLAIRSSFSRDRSSRRICCSSQNWQQCTDSHPCSSTGSTLLPEVSFRTVPMLPT